MPDGGGGAVRDDLLFVSPVTPSRRGNGLAMRAYATLRVLAERYRVCLLIAGAAAPGRSLDDGAGALCAERAALGLALWPPRRGPLRRLVTRASHVLRATPAGSAHHEQHDGGVPAEWAAARAAAFGYPFRTRAFARVHVFRLYLTPLLDALAVEASWNATQLDLDELESLTRSRLAALHAEHGDAASAARLAAEAEWYARAEGRYVPGFDRVFVCSDVDRDRVRDLGLHPSPEVAPNVVELPDVASLAASAALVRTAAAPPPFTILFVGTLGYLPNADAVAQLATRIVPALRRRGVDVRCDVVGAGLPHAVARAVAGEPRVRLRGWIEDLGAVYREADAVVVPLRAGGGTRIKILEACAHARPVVATRLAAEGIDARADHEILLADDPDAIADACARLATDRVSAEALGRRARALVARRYSPAALRAALAVDATR